MKRSSAPPGINVILGDSAGGTFFQAFDSDRLLIERDPLNCGPTPTFTDHATWRKVRAAFWQIENDKSTRTSFLVEDSLPRLKESALIHIWAAVGVSEQLFIAFMIRLTGYLGIEPDRLSLVLFEPDGKRENPTTGMGLMNPESMAAHPDPVEISSEMLADYRAAWDALTSPDPLALASFPADRPGANRWLRNAVSKMLRRFPEQRSGLPFWDRRLLEKVVSHGPRLARVVAYTMDPSHDDGDHVGDMWLADRILKMTDQGSPRPLVKISGTSERFFANSVALTADGSDVLEGRISNLALNPVDDWAAGVKLSSADGNLWLTDGDRLIRG